MRAKLRVVNKLIAWSLCCLVGSGLVACGDDDDGASADAAPNDRDSGRIGPKPDAQARDGGDADDDDGGSGGSAAPVEECPRGECDLLDPASCGGDEGCVFSPDAGAAGAPMCAPVGSAAEGERCTESADCGPGLDCSAFDGSGRCRSYCCALSRTLDCPDAQFCRLNLDVTREERRVGLCEPCDGCDPLDADACRPGLSCYPLPGSLDCTACLPPGQRKPGEACALSTDCAGGSACFRLDNGVSLCLAFCELDGEAGCADSARECSEIPGAKLPPGLALCF
jgi:hypothetical protein